MSSMNGCPQRLYSTEITKSLITQFSKTILANKTEYLNFNESDLATLRKTFIETLDKFAPLKKNYIRANHSKFVTKELSKAIMLRSKLRN